MPVLEVQRCGPVRVPLPRYQTKDSAGFDLHAALEAPLPLAPGERRLIPTGLKMALPSGYEGQVRPRSGLALRHGVTVVNAPGTIDADFRGEVSIVLINHGHSEFVVEPLQRIAQLVVARVTVVVVEEREGLDETERGQGGYGSTGL